MTLLTESLLIVDEVHNIKDNENDPKEPKKKDENGDVINHKFTNRNNEVVMGTIDSKVKGKSKGEGTEKMYKMKYLVEGSEITEDVPLSKFDKEQSKTRYDVLDNLIKNVENMKLLLLSATPMFDNSSELKTLINFLRANDKRNPINKDIDENDIEEVTRGYVSFVPGGNPYTFPFRIYPNVFAPGRSSSNKLTELEIDLYLTPLGNEQEQIYNDLLKNSKRTNNEGVDFGAALARALLITYPQLENVDKSDSNKDQSKKKPVLDLSCVAEKKINKGGLNQYEMRNGQLDFFELDNLKKYGRKLAEVIECGKDSEGIILVYSRYVLNGLLPLALALEKQGYKRFIPDNTDEGKNDPVKKTSTNLRRKK